MPDVVHDLLIAVPPARVYEAISSPSGLDTWWTKRSSGEPVAGTTYELWFGPDYDWRARVRTAVADSELEWEITEADADWIGTRVGFLLSGDGESTQVRFHHAGWKQANDHYRTSCYCWAMYLRLLKRYVEHGEVVPYEKRLDA